MLLLICFHAGGKPVIETKNYLAYCMIGNGFLPILIFSSSTMVFSTFCFSIVDNHPFAAQLATRAASRLWDAFRPATQKAYARMFREFMGFLVAAGLLINQVNTVTLLIFMEYLLHHNFSSSNIVNYMAGIRSQFILHGLDTAPFRDERIHLFQKSLTITRPLCPKTSFIITTDTLADILLVSASLEFPSTFQALYAFCFFSFLRLSKLLPHSKLSFDPTRQLCRGDLIFSHDTITVMIKWSKTIQNCRNTTTICVPALGRSPCVHLKQYVVCYITPLTPLMTHSFRF